MSELDFDFTPFLEGITSAISSATTDSVVFTAPVQSLSTSLDVFPSGGCLPGNGSHDKHSLLSSTPSPTTP